MSCKFVARLKVYTLHTQILFVFFTNETLHKVEKLNYIDAKLSY
jgi:hypothetical protein